jgi:hypothetical protein
MMGTYNMLDLVPKGRDEDDLPYTMVWVRHHDRYEPAPPAGSCCHSNTWWPSASCRRRRRRVTAGHGMLCR